MDKSNININLNIFISVFFVGVLTVIGTLNFMLHTNNSVSRDENRILAQMPNLSSSSYFDGSYTIGIDDFLRDQFFVRKSCIKFSKKMERLRGFGYAMAIDGQNSGGNGSNVKVNYYYVDDFCFYNFTRKPELETKYVDVIEQFAYKNPNLDVYNLIVPNSVAYVSDDLKQLSDDPFESMDFFVDQYRKLAYDNLKFVDVRDKFSNHNIKDLYFKTDHHWNGEGSYLAYKAFCNIAGLDAIDRLDMNKLEYNNMLGSLYNITQNDKMKDSPDTLVVYEPIYDVSMIRHYNGENGEDVVLEPAPFCVSEILMGENPSYGIYLGGDMPLCVIERANSDIAGTGRSVILVKDSFGNAFSTLITQNYDSVHVIDPRSWKGNIVEYASKVGADDIIFLNTTSTVTSEEFVHSVAKVAGVE